MTPEHDKLLCEKYPKLFAQRNKPMNETAMCWGFECGDGWFDLVDRLCSLLQWDIDHNRQPQIEVTQVKEKFGSLRFYTDVATDRQDGCISMAESMSSRICEVCGCPGATNTEGWLSTRCKKHRK